MKQTGAGRVLGVVAMVGGWLAGATGVCVAEDLDGVAAGAAARFHGAPTYDFSVSNVKCEPATPEYSYVTFDLYWSYSWRAKWTEPAATSCTGKDMEVESWDAAWVFVKFLPEKDSPAARERNYWRHATLAPDASQQVMPAGATNTVKLSDDGSRGMGVLIYRDAVGHGVNDFRGIKLRWNHSFDSVDPAKAAVKVHAIAMVYVPEGPFKVGLPAESGFCPFADGPDISRTRYDWEQGFMEIPEVLRTAIETVTSRDGGPYLRWTRHNESFLYTDGAWRGGKAIPFLLDREWNGPCAEGSRARRIGPVAGRLWSTHTFAERAGGTTFGGPVGGASILNDDYPTGYDAFYCMKYDVTQGQYVDYLNSLPPDVAAGRAFVSSEERASYGSPPSTKVKDKLPSGEEVEVTELAGNTIRSSADLRATGPAAVSEMGAEPEEKDEMDRLIEDATAEQTSDGARIKKASSIPVYWARCPFRRLQGFGWSDIRAFAVWAGLRPLTGLEKIKADQGMRDPAMLPGPASAYDTKGKLEMADEGLPNERPLRGLSIYGADFGVRVGCFASPTSDQATARATYWGISELACMSVPLSDVEFRGSHGNGILPAGRPGVSWKREFVAFTNAPPDWGRWDEYAGGRHPNKICRLVVSAGNRILKPAGERVPRVLTRNRAAQFPPADARRDDIPRVTNVKVEPGKAASTVSFDLAWKNSWRAKWTEPAERNVTGKSLTVESWDAAWVFVKFRPQGAKDEGPAILAPLKNEHRVPRGAELEVGLTDDGTRGVGVFIFRDAPGVGPNDFTGVQLRWPHGEAVDPTRGEVTVRAIAMVYVPEGPFASRSPWGHPLTIIRIPDSTQPGGYLDSGTNDMARNPEWPNGYSAFYCMKYSISQGEYADMLNSTPSGNFKVARRFGSSALAHNNARRWHSSFYGFNGYTITTNAAGVFKADVPDRMCPLLSEADITFFTVWAGLRLMTSLEYEKACRGPRAVVNGGDAWTPATCGPASGLAPSVLAAASAVGPGPSYWGVRELSLSGCVQEWPSVVASVWGWGRNYKGTHGTGAMEDPDDWPAGWFANLFYGGIWRCPGYGTVGHWINADEYDGMPWETLDGERCGRYGARAVRTAGARTDQESPLQVDALPDIAGADVAVFQLCGSFRNDGDKPMKVELASTLPDVCFPQGAESRVFTAAPKGTTPFKVLTILTARIVQDAARPMLPVRLRAVGGDVLAECHLKLRMGSATGPAPVIQSLEGGALGLNVRNATERPVTVLFQMSSLPEVRIGASNRTVAVAAGAHGQVAFPVPPQWFPKEGLCRIPYGANVGGGMAVIGEAVVDLRVQTRWWIARRVKTGPKLAGDMAEPLKRSSEDIGGMDGVFSEAGDVFTLAKPVQGWRPVTCGSSVALGEAGALPSRDSLIIGASRMMSVDEVNAVGDVRALDERGKEISLAPPEKGEHPFFVRVWVNDTVAFDTRLKEKERVKPVRIRKGENTVVVEWQSNADSVATAANVWVGFKDAKSGKLVPDLLFDMDKR